MTIEELLTRYERWDTVRRARHVPHPSKAGFVEGFPDVGFGKSKQTLYDYLEHMHLPFPLLPEDPSGLVFVVFGQTPFDLTWVSQSVADALGCDRADLVGHNSIDALRAGKRWCEAKLALVRGLRSEPSLRTVCIERTHLVTAERLQLPVRLEARYTGEQTDRFYFMGEVLGAASTAALQADVEFNVYPDYVYQLKSQDTRGRDELFTELPQVPGYEDALIAQFSRMRHDPEYLRHFIDKAIGTYQPPERRNGHARD